jgi:hypothetical protein
MITAAMFQPDFMINFKPRVQLFITITATPILSRSHKFLLGFANRPFRFAETNSGIVRT